MSTKHTRVTADSRVDEVAAFIKECGAKSFSGHFVEGGVIYLLKPTRKGGTTLARVLVTDENGAEAVFDQAWAKATGEAQS